MSCRRAGAWPFSRHGEQTPINACLSPPGPAKRHHDHMGQAAHADCRMQDVDHARVPRVRACFDSILWAIPPNQSTGWAGPTGVALVAVNSSVPLVTLIDKACRRRALLLQHDRSLAVYTRCPSSTLQARHAGTPLAPTTRPHRRTTQSKCAHSLSRSPSSTLGDPTRANSGVH